MSVEVKNKKVRVLSAKVTHSQSERQRPFSGIASQTYTRKQLIENTYVGQLTQPTRVISARSNQNRYVSAPVEDQKMQYRLVNRQNRQKQQMAEEISALKQTVNRLVEQLAHERGKVETVRRKNTKYQKIFNMEFEDDKQWSSNKVSNHLVSGIKNMYQNMKQKYETKCKQFETLITKIQATDILEYETYIQVLEGSNKQLQYKLNAFQNQNNALVVPNRSQKNASQFVITQLTLEKEKLSVKFKQSEAKLKKANQSNKDMTLKIQFLQKLIIEKDNNLYALQRKIKRSMNQQQKLKQQSQTLNKLYSDLQQKYESQRQQLLKTIRDNEASTKAALENLKSQKDYKIGILEANNVYVQQMLSQIRKTNTQLNRQLQQAKILNAKQTKGDKFEQKETLTDQGFTHKKRVEQPNKLLTTNFNSKGERVPQKANKRYSQDAVKKRKIQLNEVLQIAQLIRYRLMIKRVSIEKLKNLFNFNEQRLSTNEWQSQYITMQEVLAILKNKPINLDEDDAILLSRYLIQDVQQQYVYCDQLNQNHREVVKSIIKTLIQQYPLFEEKDIDKRAGAVLKDYRKSLSQTLKQVQRSGIITKAKFFEVLKSLGIEASNQVKQYFIARMALSSKGINSLAYKNLFDQL